MTTPATLRLETVADHRAINDLHFAAFEGPDVPKMVTDLRAQKGFFPTVSLVAAGTDSAPLGHVMISHAWVDGPKALLDVMVLSPLGVHPSVQGQGIGTQLLRGALKHARDLNAPLVFLEGNSAYYGSRGFRRASDLGFRRPSTRIPIPAFQVACLPGYDPAITGTFVYRDVHWRNGVGLYR